jgi:hypothetical protein
MAYKQHLERFIEDSAMEVRPLRGMGVEIKVPDGRRKRERGRALFSAGMASESAASFLSRYAAGLAALPHVLGPAASYLHSLAASDRDLWTTLLPTASALQRAAGATPRDAAMLLEETRSWALAELRAAGVEAATGPSGGPRKGGQGEEPGPKGSGLRPTEAGLSTNWPFRP